MERSVSVRTPESIDFYYELAGLGSRFMAVAIDFLVQALAAIVISIIFLSAARGIDALARNLHANQARWDSVVVAVWFLTLFLIFFAYFVLFEVLWHGQTPGKKLMGIRVVRDGGYPVDFMSSLIRNALRLIEFSVGAYAISAISALLSPQNKRLGDLAAGTIVVRDRGFEVSDPKRWLSGDEAVMGAGLAGTSNLTADEVALVQRYVYRRTTLDPKAAAEAAARIASALRPKLGPAADRLGDDELLVRIAASGSRAR